MKVEVQTASTKGKGQISLPGEVQFERRFPVGAEPVPGGGTHFRVWAPNSDWVRVQLYKRGEASSIDVELSPEAKGYFAGHVAEARPGMLYRYRLKNGLFPDPASRFQPEGTHGPSQIIDPSNYHWKDGQWRGLGRGGQVIYEIHIGTFTGPGTWAAAERELPELASLGITTIELMPVAEFPGRFGWGYDGVDLFAPTRLYGQPDDFRRFVDQAHHAGLGVILDVVYNHFGPDGNFLKNFSGDYFTHRYKNEWGEAINFDGENCEQVREFFCANAAYWIGEFHLDGLRLDATQQIFDSSTDNIQAAIVRQVRQAARGRNVFIVAENEPQKAALVRSCEKGGYGLDALWNDDFHHAAMVALCGRAEAYYSDFSGRPQEFVSLAKRGFIYQGQFSCWQNNPRGSWSFDLEPDQFVNYLQNHDQVANSLSGLRAHQLGSPGCWRALTALLLLGPATPMLFQGQEFAASAPFLYFADHNPELSKLVAEGRKEFLSQFPGIKSSESQAFLLPPHSFDTFARCKLDFSERSKNAGVYRLHRDLIKLRKEDPVFSRPRSGQIDGAVLGPSAFLLRFFSETNEDRLLLVNLGTDLQVAPVAEPLFAPVSGFEWAHIWTSESPAYGGLGAPPSWHERGWRIPGHSALVFAANRVTENKHPESRG